MKTPLKPTMLWTKKFMPVPGVSHPPLRPLKPSVTAYITLLEGFRVWGSGFRV